TFMRALQLSSSSCSKTSLLSVTSRTNLKIYLGAMCMAAASSHPRQRKDLPHITIRTVFLSCSFLEQKNGTYMVAHRSLPLVRIVMLTKLGPLDRQRSNWC